MTTIPLHLSFFAVTLASGVETRWPPMRDGQVLDTVAQYRALGHDVLRVVREADGRVFISTAA